MSHTTSPAPAADQHQPDNANLGNPMCHNVPECATLKIDLSAQQLKAIRLLIAGGSDSSVARELGLNRHTIHRWRTRHPAFRAELARRRESLWHNNTDHLNALLPKALKVLSQHLKSNYDTTSARAAVSLLKLAGAGKFTPPKDPTDETDLLRQEILKDRLRANPANPDTTILDSDLESKLKQLLSECEEKPQAAPHVPTSE
jgi:hypothetical protein